MTRPAMRPLTLRGLTLRNRFLKAGTYEGMTPQGRVTDALIDHHATLARHRVGMTTVSYGAVSSDGRTFERQLLVDEGSVPGLARLADAVHAQGGAVSLQLAHCGGFSKNAGVSRGAPAGPSAAFNAYGAMSGIPRIRAMDDRDLAQVPLDFAAAARHAVDAGFDALELHMGHGYLLSQFLSPLVNRRRDAWGGPLEHRLRLPLEVVAAVRDVVGPDVPLIAKTNLSDGLAAGLQIDEAVRIAQALQAAGIDLLVPSGGLVFRTPFYLLRGAVPLRQMVEVEKHRLQALAMRLFAPFWMRPVPYQSSFFLQEARQVRDAVDIPVGLLGGVDSAGAVDEAMAEGFAMVVLGRALLSDPDFVDRYAQGEAVLARCTHCNQCIAEMDRGGVRCVLDDVEASA